MKQRNYAPSLEFYCRQSRKDKKGYAIIEMSITVGGVRRFINTNRKERPEVFNRKKLPTDLSDYLNLLRNRFNTIQTEMLRNGEPLTVDSLKDYMKTGGYKSYTVGDMIDGFLGLKAKEWNNDVITYGQYQKYEYAANVLLEYLGREKEVTNITPALMQTIYVDLRGKYKNETMCGYMTRIKSFLRYAMDNGKLTVNPFVGIKITKAKHRIQYLTESEIMRISTANIDNESLSNIRDAFLLQASTGLAYSDVYNLRKEDIQITDDGTHYIKKCRQKTGTEYTSVILPLGVEVLKKHDYQLKIISNQKYNMMLKNIQALCGIQTKMTTHLARKTYATTLLNRGVRVEVVSKALGHKNTKITLAAYSELMQSTVINEIKDKL